MEDLSKFLPLYFGGVCQIVWTEECSEDTGLEDGLFRIDGTVLDNLDGIESCKIHCRPLSSMTEEEKEEMKTLYTHPRQIGSRTLPSFEVSKQWAALQTQYLLSKGFDIFQLKEKGLAIYPEEL